MKNKNLWKIFRDELVRNNVKYKMKIVNNIREIRTEYLDDTVDKIIDNFHHKYCRNQVV